MSKDGLKAKSMVRDGMKIEIDVPIPMDDGLALRADVYRPLEDGRFPALISYGPYAKGLAFQEAYKPQWDRMVSEHPDVLAGSTNKYQAWEAPDPRSGFPTATSAFGSTHAARAARPDSSMYSRRGRRRISPSASNGRPRSPGAPAGRVDRHLVLRDEPMAGRGARPPHLVAICPFEGASDFYRDACATAASSRASLSAGFPARFRLCNMVWARVADELHNRRVGRRPGDAAGRERARNRADFGQAIRPTRWTMESRISTRDWSTVKTPLLSPATGAAGAAPARQRRGFLHAGSEQKWLEMHGLEHWTHFYTDYGTG